MESTEEKPVKLSYKDKLKFANAVSQPMASKGTTKRLMKLIRKGMIDAIYCVISSCQYLIISFFHSF